ncbi:MAG: thioredoxin family protein [bacterium]
MKLLIRILLLFPIMVFFANGKPLLNPEIIESLKKEFSGLKNPVTIKVFTQEIKCNSCKENDQLVAEVAAVNPLITVKEYKFEQSKKEANKYGIDKIPASVIIGDKYRGVRLFGIPTGYMFGTLIEAIKTASTSSVNATDDLKSNVKKVKKTIHIKALVSPTCPYCPGAVVNSQELAFLSSFITADMIQITDFPYLGTKYNVEGVPLIIINETTRIPGAVSKEVLIEKILQIK